MKVIDIRPPAAPNQVRDMRTEQAFEVNGKLYIRTSKPIRDSSLVECEAFCVTDSKTIFIKGEMQVKPCTIEVTIVG